MSEQQGDERQLYCRVITPEGVIFDEEADMVIARIADGDIGVLAQHAPTISTVEIGEVRVRQGEETVVFATSDGFFKTSENLVQILVERAIRPEDINIEEAERQIEEAERELAELDRGRPDWERIEKEIERRRGVEENLVLVARRHGEQG